MKNIVLAVIRYNYYIIISINMVRVIGKNILS